MGTFATREWPRHPLRPPKRIKRKKAAKKIRQNKKKGVGEIAARENGVAPPLLPLCL